VKVRLELPIDQILSLRSLARSLETLGDAIHEVAEMTMRILDDFSTRSVDEDAEAKASQALANWTPIDHQWAAQ
jgi:phosphate uptake regulator